MRLGGAVVLLLSLAAVAFALLPDPSVDAGGCGLAAPGRLCDPEHLLSSKGQIQINEILLEMEKAPHSTCSSGPHQIGVAIVNRMDLSDLHPVPGDPMDQVAAVTRNLHDYWGLGQKDCNNGALMYVAVRDRKMFISTGKGLMDILTDSDIDYIIEAMKPYLKDAKYDTAILTGVRLIKDYLNGIGPRPSFLWRLVSQVAPMLWWVVALGAMFGFMWYKDRGYNQCKTKLGLIERQAKAQRFDHASCPICLEEFSKAPEGAIDESKRQILDCGHAFHHKCLDEWWKQRESCPVCRHRMDNEGPDTKPSSSSSSHPSSSTQTQSSDPTLQDQHYEDLRYRRELDFHLLRLHHMYPRYVTRPMITQWRIAPTPTFTSSPEFTSLRPSAQSSKGSGRSSFGGGSSRGGGGRGGSW